jgi:hypothetical protein
MALHAVKERLPPNLSGRIEGFVAPSWAHLSLGFHAGGLLLAGLLGLMWPAFAAAVSLFLAISLLGEGTGQFSLVRWAFPKTASYNLTARMPSDTAQASLILVAPLDVPRWRVLNRRWFRFRPLRLVFGSAMSLAIIQLLHALAKPWGVWTGTVYGVGLAVLAATVALAAVWHRAGDGRDDGGSPAVLLELMHRLAETPIPNLDVWFTFVGCGRQARGGMDAFLALHEKTLTSPCLVIALDDAGRAPLNAVISEGSLYPQDHRPTGPALVERLRWAGVDLDSVDRASPTDARVALLRGYRSLAFSGGSTGASPQAVARAAQIVEVVSRWYGHDVRRVEGDRDALTAIAAAIQPEPELELEDAAVEPALEAIVEKAV